MRRFIAILTLVIPVVLSLNAIAQGPAAFRVLMGVTDTTGTRWDGTFKITQAGQYTLEPWRFAGSDNLVGQFFHISTHQGMLFHTANESPVLANGFIIR